MYLTALLFPVLISRTYVAVFFTPASKCYGNVSERFLAFLLIKSGADNCGCIFYVCGSPSVS